SKASTTPWSPSGNEAGHCMRAIRCGTSAPATMVRLVPMTLAQEAFFTAAGVPADGLGDVRSEALWIARSCALTGAHPADRQTAATPPTRQRATNATQRIRSPDP